LPPLAQGQVLVRATHSGISPGTEMLAYRGDLDADMAQDESIGSLGGSFRYPFRYGYSAVGIVEQSRASFAEGSRVFAFHPHQDRFIVTAEDVIALETVSPREATLFPLVETAFQITLDAGMAAGERVIVMGLGPVGALTAALLARSGVDVTGVDPLPWRRAALAGLGQEGLGVAGPQSVAGMEPVPVVIDASGNPDAVRLGLELLAHEGTLFVASWFGSREVNLPLGRDFHRRRLSIRSTQVSTIPARLMASWDKEKRRAAVVELMGDLPLSAFASHTFPFEQAPKAYAAIDRPREGLIHTALSYG
jgi:2-desacetyl-2-hydroxyethyl bacteriochlorophyllide A dehydrogenase